MKAVYNLLYPIAMCLSRIKAGHRLRLSNARPETGKVLVIYAANHTNMYDGPLFLRAVGRHCRPLYGKQPLYLVDGLYLKMLGVIWVDRASREGRSSVKQALIDALRRGYSIQWFPEATWNMTDNLPMLPMRWGIIDVAQQSGALIVPLALDYEGNARTCNVRFGQPIDSTGVDRAEGIRQLRDSLATLRWEQWSERGVHSRAELDVEGERRRIFHAVEEYPPLEYEVEMKYVFNLFPSAPDLFLVPNGRTAFLFNKRLRGAPKAFPHGEGGICGANDG